MRLERLIECCLPAESPEGARALLADPAAALGRLRVFRDLELSGDVLQGSLAAPFALVGEVRFPFSSRFELAGDSARLTALPPPEAGDTAAELDGLARLDGVRVCYRAEVALELALPQGEKWGGRAFHKMAEAAFERVLARTLNELAG